MKGEPMREYYIGFCQHHITSRLSWEVPRLPYEVLP